MNVKILENLFPAFSRTRSVYEEGMIGGLVGAAAIAIWFLILDTLQGRPLFTPTVLGTALFRKGEGLISPETLPISLDMAFAFTWVHGLTFIAIGVCVARLLRLAERDPNYGFGILLLFIVFELAFIAVSLLFSEGVLHALTLPTILVGNLLSAAAMGIYFYRRHPRLRILP